MQITMFRAKLHQARVTEADLNYEGSIGIDTDLLRESGMFPYEKVLVVDIENAERFETYIIPAAAGSGTISVNGAAARLVHPNDRLIIMSFVHVDYPPPADWQPRVVILNADNTVNTAFGPLTPMKA